MKIDKEKWKDYTIEMIIFFLALYAASAVESWVQSLQNKKQETEYLHALHVELVEDIQSLDSLVQHYEREDSAYGRMLTIIETKNLQEAESIEGHLNLLYDEQQFFISTNTYEAIKNAGALNILSNEQVKVLYNKLYTEDLKVMTQMSVTREIIRNKTLYSD